MGCRLAPRKGFTINGTQFDSKTAGSMEERWGLVRVLENLVAGVVRHPWLTLALAFLTAAAAFSAAVSTLRINTDPSAFVSSDETFVRNFREFQAVFSHVKQTTLIVVSSEDRAAAGRAAEALVQRLEAEPETFTSVFYPTGHPFYERNAFLFLGEERLNDVIGRLAAAQAPLAILAREPNLAGIAEFLSLTTRAYDEPVDLPALAADMMAGLADTAEKVALGETPDLPWFERLLAREFGASDHLIIVQGQLDFDAALPAKALLQRIRDLAAEAGIAPGTGIDLRLTGRVPLEYEELKSAQSSVTLAGIVSLLALTVILSLGVRSFRIIGAVLVTLLTGLAWTLGFAVLAVGELNILSVAFSVLFIGLGIDFAIHFALRIQEAVGTEKSFAAAALRATQSQGRAIGLCALTSAIGFLSFLPTDYRALADLGAISGGGMALAYVAAFTVLPAILTITGAPPQVPRLPFAGQSARIIRTLTLEHPAKILIPAGVAGVLAAFIAPQVVFDYSTLGLKDPNSESVRTLEYLQSKGVKTDFTLNVIAADGAEARRLAEEIARIEGVEAVDSPETLVPGDQDLKRETLDEAVQFLWPALSAKPRAEALTAEQRLERLLAIRAGLAALLAAPPPESDPARARFREEARRLDAAIARLLGPGTEAEDTARLETELVAGVPERVAWLGQALAPPPLGLDDAPAELRERVVASDGRYLLTVKPRDDVRDVVALERLIEAVARIAPEVTGRPVMEAGIGSVVVRSLVEAFAIAGILILGILLVSLGNVRESLLVLVPLLWAGTLTLAVSALAGLAFNFANVILLPLILGLGVDSGIHMVSRFRNRHSMTEVLGSSTPRAVLLSVLTTLGSFGSLALSSHNGIKSMGIMLSLSMVFLLVATLLVLPALMAVFERPPKDPAAPAGA